MKDLLFLEAEDVQDIHDFILESNPGVKGVDLGKLEAVVGRIKNISVYEGIETPFELAAHYCVAIARGHAFTDCNKRTAFCCMVAVLDANGYPVPNKEDVMLSIVGISKSDLIVRIAEGGVSAQEVARLLSMLYITGMAGYGIFKLVQWLAKKP